MQIIHKDLEKMYEAVRELNKGIEQSDELLWQKARWAYMLNKISFWDDLPILMDLINYEIDSGVKRAKKYSE